MKLQKIEIQDDCVINEDKIDDKEQSTPDFVISVIVPVYNAERYIKTCLDSLINQTYKNLEIICIDDGSSDHSLEILRYYEKSDERVKVYTQKNAGPSEARNKGLDHAKGKYVSFVDADDYLELNSYEILAECAIQKENWDLIIFGGNVIGEANDWLRYVLSTSYAVYKNCKPRDVLFKEKAARPFLWLHFIKRELLEYPTKIRFDVSMNLGEDQIYQFLYIPRAKNVMTIDLKLYNYRTNNNASLMHFYNNQRIKKTECHFQIIEKVIEEWKENGYYDSNKDVLWTWIVNFIYFTIVNLPAEFKKKYADRFLDMMQEKRMDSYWISEWEQGHLCEIQEWSLNPLTSEEELERFAEK